jgi:tubulin-specific chaperone E
MLDNNLFTSLAFLPNVMHAFPNLKALSLQGNQISSIGLLSHLGSDREAISFPQLGSLNLSHNLVADYSFINTLPQLFPRLTSLRVSNNPFFSSGTSTDPPAYDKIPYKATLTSSTATAPPHRILASPRTSRPDAPYSLTLARIPTLLSLNHSTITPRDREEGEIYYIAVAERELSAAIAETPVYSREGHVSDVKRRFPRYEELCRKYERESVLDKEQSASKETPAQTPYTPGTLGIRLVKANFYIPQKDEGSRATSSVIPTTFSRLIPRTISVYTLKALLARTFSLPALQFRLIYESPELDPVVAPRGGNDRANWDAWGDWDLDHPPKDPGAVEKQGKKWKKREVEILDGTREWGFYIEDGMVDATIRIEPLKQAGREMGEGSKN